MRKLIILFVYILCISCRGQSIDFQEVEFQYQTVDGDILITDSFMTLGRNTNSWLTFGAKLYNTTDGDLTIELQFKGLDNKGNILIIGGYDFNYNVVVPANSSIWFRRARTLRSSIKSIELKETKYRIIREL
ncbi:hypothetical protein [Aquimarina algiphila]|uniref:hypothetical protein n=1 Tax=Aquimarina algiphila TaxID=2047982 RepID=UPI00232B4A7E|nr:hypothetical protein [Aquimarina algiphila]